MNEARDTRNDGHHHNGERIYADRPIGLEVADLNPGHQRDDMLLQLLCAMGRASSQISVQGRMGFVRRAVAETRYIGKELVKRKRASGQHRTGCDQHDDTIADDLVKQTEQRRDTGRQNDEKEKAIRKHTLISPS